MGRGRRRSRSADYTQDSDDDYNNGHSNHSKSKRNLKKQKSKRRTRSLEDRRGGYDDDGGDADDEYSHKSKKATGFFNFGGNGYRQSDLFKMGASKNNKQMYSQTLAAVSDIEKLAQKKGVNTVNERFRVTPDYAYPNTFMNREELRQEMNAKSEYFHDLRPKATKKTNEIGQLRVEILQCFGLPTYSLIRETSAYCIAVSGDHAFKTDVMPPVANPMWLAKMRRACLFPILHAYARCFVGVFDNNAEGSSGDFVGRIVIDVARLRPGCMYDFTLPLRHSAHVFSKEQRGAVRVRLHLMWHSERAAITSYIPKHKPKFVPNENFTVNCLDEKSFKNVVNCVHGSHIPGKFSMTLLKATMREVNFTRIHLFRYLRKKEAWNLMYWEYPFISGFVFLAWMHCVYMNTVRYVPGHILTFLLLHLWKNYAYYAMDSPLQNGFIAPTFEEILFALLRGTKKRRYIEPLNMEMDENHVINPVDHMEAADDYEEANRDAVPITEVAEAMRKSMRVQTHKYRLRTYKNCFLGSEAVDFLTSFGFAHSREEAVYLGRRLAVEVKLFQHVAKQQDFEDRPYYYQFLDYDTKRYVIKGHQSIGRALFKAIGFWKEDEILEARDHVEFPFATGADHGRFTVKESIVIRSAESKKLVREQQAQKEIIDCADFGVIPQDELPPTDQQGNVVDDVMKVGAGVAQVGVGVAQVGVGLVTGTVGIGVDVVRGTAGAVQRGVRRASLLGNVGGMNAQTPASPPPREQVPLPPEEGSEHMSMALTRANNKRMSLDNMLTNTNMAARDSIGYGDPDDIYLQLKARNNPTLDELLEEREKAAASDIYAYDSDDDVDDVIKMKRKGFVLEEKILKKPPNQDINIKSGKGDKSFPKSIAEVRHKAHGFLLHLFNLHAYSIDTTVFPHTLPEDNDIQSVSTKKSKRTTRFGFPKAKKHDDDEKKKRRPAQTPYDARKDEYDRILGTNKYSHANPWINRVGVVVQPIVEIVQGWLFMIRAIFNLFTWQDPYLSFWVAFFGPFVIILLHIMPYRIIFFVMGIYYVGPQNYFLRQFRKKPDFDKLLRKKKTPKGDDYTEIQFFSSETPGNQNIKYINVEPKQVKKVVVPYSQLKFNRFYDWPPEPQYARVYASAPPRNALQHHHFQSDDEDSEEENQHSFWFDPTKALKTKKKKKKGAKKIAAQIKKGTGSVVIRGGELMSKTKLTTAGVVKGTVGVTKKVTKGTAKVTKGVAKGTANAAKNTWFGMKKKKKKKKSKKSRHHHSDDDDSFD